MFQFVSNPLFRCTAASATLAAVLGAGALKALAQPQPPAQPLPQPSARTLKVEVVAQGLEHPWAVAFLPEGGYLVTERPGRLRMVDTTGRIGAALTGLPEIAAGGQGGLLDVMLDKDFVSNRRLYFCYAEPDRRTDSLNSTALASATYAAGAKSLADVKPLFSQKPKVNSRLHFGCRIAQDRQGTLYLGLGERFNQKEQAQTLDNHLGKVVRVQLDGHVPADNPLVGRTGALAEIWSWGHRNVQAAAMAPDGRFWVVEHGPQGGDELNLVRPGRNYGWPVITYGENYGGGKIGKGTAQQGMEQPVHYWVPSIAPSGLAVLTSDRYGSDWKGSLFIGSLKFQRLHRVQLDGEKVVRDEILLGDLGARVRDVRQGPDGLLYLLTDEPRGKLLRLLP